MQPNIASRRGTIKLTLHFLHKLVAKQMITVHIQGARCGFASKTIKAVEYENKRAAFLSLNYL